MKFKLVEKFNLNEDVFFHKAYRDKNGNVVDDQGIPIDPKITPDLAKRFSPFWDKDDDDIVDPSEYNPFTDGVYPDWDEESDSDSASKGNGNKRGKQSSEGDKESDGGDGNEDDLDNTDDQEKEKRSYSNNSTNNKGGGSGGGGGRRGSSSQGGQGGKKNKNKQDKDENEDQRIFIDTSTGKRYKKLNDKYVEI